MLEIFCKDVSSWECDFAAREENADDIRQTMIDHFLAVHGDQMASLDDKQQNKISENIEDRLLGV